MLARMVGIVEALVAPSGFSFLLVALGLILCVPSRTRKAGAIALGAAGLLLAIFSSGKTATFLMSPLEYQYPRVADNAPPARAIVVLAAYAADDPDLSLSDRGNDSALYRVTEGFLLWQRCKECVVIVTGSRMTTIVMSDVLSALGVPPENVQLDTDAANTSASAANLRNQLGQTPFYLVTSAGHMPRAMGVFQKAGMHPLPAPTDHKLPKTVAQAEWALRPFHLECSDLAVHERIGVWWYRMRGLI